MKINETKVKERLAGIPDSKRSHIYDASIVIEFLTKTLMPTAYFLPPNFSPKPGTPLGQKSMRRVAEGKSMMVRDLYELYLQFREEKDYTSRIESRYIFGIIIKNLRYYKNKWEFVVYRVGVAQLWYIGPVMLRSDASVEDQNRFKATVEDTSPEATQIEADPVSDPDEPVEDIGEDIPEEPIGAVGEPISEENFVGPVGQGGNQFTVVEPERFKEATIDVDIDIELPREEY